MVSTILIIFILLMTVTIHEVSHGMVAYWLGDKTAYYQKRLTLNPLRHIDLFWTILFPALLLFATGGRFALGMAKPVPVNFTNLKNPRRDMVLVGAAGPLSNLIMAMAFAKLFHVFQYEPFLFGVYVNLGLGIFNLIPIPPMDGSRLVSGFLPKEAAKIYDSIEPFGFWIVLILYMTGALFAFLRPAINFFATWLLVPTAF